MAKPLPAQPRDRHGFKIGIICALTLEAGMVEMVFDQRWKTKTDGTIYGKAPNDPNTYRTGVIAGHNVVLGYCPEIGNISASQVASWMRASFTDVKIMLVVGICGAVPFYTHEEEKEEIVLGDCLISTGVVQFDFGRQGPGGFEMKDGLGRANAQVRGFMNMLQTPMNRQDLTEDLSIYLRALRDVDPKRTGYLGADQDRLYKPTYIHTHSSGEPCGDCNVRLGICEKSCKDLGCDEEQLEYREKLHRKELDTTPSIHFGYFGSSSTVIKSGLERDKLAKAAKIIAFEMEGAGTWDVCPTIVIKAACDYADSHKNKKWQKYAAAVAAAGMKAFLAMPGFLQDMGAPEDDSLYYTIPFLQNRRFVGREQKLQELENRLFHQECHELAIYGLGGVGKTQLALAFCYAVKAKYPDRSIFWISALSVERFTQDCAEIVKECSLTESESNDVVEIVRKYLSSKEAGKWLLVVDNVDDKAVLVGNGGTNMSLPKSETGITIFTTRYKDIAVDIADKNTLNVGQMSLAEAKTFLQMSLGQDHPLEEEEIVEKFLEELTLLPLAITQATSYIAKTSISISEYLALMQHAEDETVKLLSREFEDKTREKGARNAVAVTWLVSFDLIKRDETHAANILFFLATIENKAIPRSMLPMVESLGDLTHAIGVLTSYSFLVRQEGGQTYNIHRLVHLAVKTWMREAGILQDWRHEAITHLGDIFPSYEWKNRSLWQAYSPHAIRILQDTEHIFTKQRADLCIYLGLCLEEDGRFAEALKWISQCVAWRNAVLPEDDSGRLCAQHALAYVLWRGGEMKRAVEMLEDVVAIQARTLAEDDSTRLDSQHQLAVTYVSNGQVQEAVELLEKVVAVEARVLAEDDPSKLASQHALADAYHSNGQVQEAVELLEKVVAVEARVLAEDDPSKLASQHALASAYHSNGQVQEAVELLESVVAVEVRVLAEHHPTRLASQHNLAMGYETLGRLDEAVLIMQNVVTIQQSSLPASHPDRIRSETQLSRMLQQVNGS